MPHLVVIASSVKPAFFKGGSIETGRRVLRRSFATGAATLSF